MHKWCRALLGCLLVILASCGGDPPSSPCPSATEVDVPTRDGVPTDGLQSLTTDQKERAWSEARATPWTTAIFEHATDRAGFAPIGSTTALIGIAVTVFFEGPVTLPACLPSLSGGAEVDPPGARKITTDTRSLTVPAATVFVIDGRAQWMLGVPEPVVEEFVKLSEPWDPTR